MERIGCEVRIMEHRQRVADADRFGWVNVLSGKQAGVPQHQHGNHGRVALTPLAFGLALIAALMITTDVGATTLSYVIRERWEIRAESRPLSFAEMQFMAWNTQLPGDVGNPASTSSTSATTYADMRFHEENTWLPEDNLLALLAEERQTPHRVLMY